MDEFDEVMSGDLLELTLGEYLSIASRREECASEDLGAMIAFTFADDRAFVRRSVCDYYAQQLGLNPDRLVADMRFAHEILTAGHDWQPGKSVVERWVFEHSNAKEAEEQGETAEAYRCVFEKTAGRAATQNRQRCE